MLVRGSYLVKAPRKKVWKYIQNPKVLEKTIPGVKKIKKKGNSYKSTINLKFGPFSGVYKGQFKIVNKKKPKSMLLKVKGSSKSNSIKARAIIRLSKAKKGTIVSYESEVDIGGMLFFGNRMVNGIAKRIANHFFINLEKQLSKKTSI